MGIRFRCHHCEHELNLKNFQAGRRARCPVCSGRFRVPTTSCDFSSPLENDEQELASTALQADQPGAGHGAVSPVFELQQPTGDLERFKRPAQELQRPDTATPLKSAEPTPLASGKLLPKKGTKKRARTNAAAASQAPASPTAVTQTQSPAAAPTGNGAAVESPSVAATSGGASDAAQAAGGARNPGIPRAIAEAPQAVWYVRPPSGGQFGPADSTTFYQWMRENRVAREALVWRDGWPQWMTAAEAFEDYFGSKWLVPDPAVVAAAPAEALASPTSSQGVPIEEPSSSIERIGTAEPASDSGLALAGLQRAGAQVGSPADVRAAVGSELASPVRPLARRKRRQTNYALWISVLTVLAVTLVGVLITVLMSQ